MFIRGYYTSHRPSPDAQPLYRIKSAFANVYWQYPCAALVPGLRTRVTTRDGPHSLTTAIPALNLKKQQSIILLIQYGVTMFKTRRHAGTGRHPVPRSIL